MHPEFTCGKTILPACSHFTALLPPLWAKSGKTMLPARGKTMSKVAFWFFILKVKPYLRMKVDPRAGIPPNGMDVLQECTWPAWMDGG
jgi:hypothetical protein